VFSFLLTILACGPGSESDGRDSDEPPLSTLELDHTPLDPHDPVEPVGEWISESFEDRQLVWYMPDNPRAVVWHFHGNDGSGADARLLETVAILNELVKIDFGFVAGTCDDGHQWDADRTGTDNNDLMRLTRLRDHIMGQSSWAEDTPLFAWGFSSGARMTAHFADFALDEGWPIRALAVHNGNPDRAVVPTVFVEAENDDSASPDSMAATRALLADAGLDVEAYMAFEAPLDPMRFLRIPTFTEEKSQFQFDELVTWQHIDSDGTRITSHENINGVVNQIRDESTGWDPVRTGDQLRVVWRTHRVDGQFALEERNFFVSQLP